jgi:hypothetical protein
MRGVAVVLSLLATLTASGCGDGRAGSEADPSVPVTDGFPLYGPGAHWIDRARTGSVTFDSLAAVDVDLNRDGAADLTVEVRGPTTVFRSSAQPADPSRPHHRNHLDLEIVSMSLTGAGVSFRAGDGVGNFSADGPLFSLGTSDEVPDVAELAADEFAVFFAADVFGAALHNEQPLRMVATIDRLPPIGNRFELAGPPVPMLTSSGAPSAVQIIAVRYTPLDPTRRAR